MNKKVMPILGICTSIIVMSGVLYFAVLYIRCFFYVTHHFSLYEEDLLIYGGLFFLVISQILICFILFMISLYWLSGLMSKKEE